MTLEPGDLIAMGTCSGVALAFEPPKWLRDGDVVEVENRKYRNAKKHGGRREVSRPQYEAMKTEFTLRAPMDGIVGQVRHAVDDMVEEGAELITFAAEAEQA